MIAHGGMHLLHWKALKANLACDLQATSVGHLPKLVLVLKLVLVACASGLGPHIGKVLVVKNNVGNAQ